MERRKEEQEKQQAECYKKKSPVKWAEKKK